MRLVRCLAGGLVCLAFTARAGAGPAPDAPAKEVVPSPLRLIPAEADLLIEVKQPRRLAETVYGLDLLKQLEVFPSFKELLNSTPARRSRQLVAYFERELGAKWPELLDRLAGGGVAVGVKFGPNPAPTLLVVQGSDEKLVRKFADLGVEVIEQELARQDKKGRAVKGSYEGVETISIDKGLHLAVAGATILLSNNEGALRRGLDLHLGRGKKSLADVPEVAEGARLLPKDPLVNLWLNVKNVRKGPVADELYRTPRNNPQLTVLFGGYLDVIGRTPYLAAGLCREKDGFLLTVRMPCGREGMGSDAALHLPPRGQTGAKPLLEPRGVLASESFYLDQGAIWRDRARLFPEKQVKALENFNKNSGRFLAGSRLSELLTQAGPYHRLVVVDQPTVPYKTKPKQVIPAFALVTDLREPEKFGKSMESVLRGAAFFVGFQVKLKLVEEKHAGCNIVGYRFAEDAPLKQDVNDIRFNFSPCFVRVGDQFVWCSTLELCRELVDLLQQEAKAPAAGAPARTRSKVYSAGVADLLKGFQEQLVTQTILDQAVEPGEAQKQVKEFIDLVRRLGTLTTEATFGDNDFRYDIRTRSAR